MPEIELKKIKPNRLNPREDVNIEKLNELSDSIKESGIIEPIIVRPIGDKYEVVVGERRYRAAQQANLKKIPVIIREYTDDEVMELNLIENIQREDLSDIEKGKITFELMQRYPQKYPTKSKLASKIGVTQQAITNWIQTAQIVPKEVQKMIAPAEPTSGKIPKGKISGDMAVSIARRIKDKKTQVALAREITERRIPKPIARKIITQVARETEKPKLEPKIEDFEKEKPIPPKPVIKKPKEIVDKIIEEIEEKPALLPFSRKHAEDIKERIKTQTARKGLDPKIKSGSVVRAAITHFADLKITEVYKKKLGDFDEEDAKREGGYTLEEFKEVWKKFHREWNPNESVYVIRFKLDRVI